MFVDEFVVICRGGDGGDGCLSFRKEAHVPRGGPDGGDGGRGGRILVEASENVTNLAHLVGRRHWKGGRGTHGKGKGMTGEQGEDITIPVPVGTLVYDEEQGNLLRDMKEHGDSIIVSQGGRGGWGNIKFKSSTNRAPHEHLPGRTGQERRIRLVMKVIADVGLVGKPNAGKSTLLSRMTRATPEIASYPFTTKYPNLGIARLGYDKQFVIADIPGLIEGAHAGIGLGHEFLKHVERTKVFVHLVEPTPADETDPVENYNAIREELRLYDEKLLTKPELIVVTKCEMLESEDVAKRLSKAIRRPVLRISAVTGKGLPELSRELMRLVSGTSSDDDWRPTKHLRAVASEVVVESGVSDDGDEPEIEES